MRASCGTRRARRRWHHWNSSGYCRWRYGVKTVQNSLWRPRYSGEVIRQLATLLQAGLPLAEGLELLAQQQPHKQWQALLRVLAQELANGVSLSSGLRNGRRSSLRSIWR